jgi:hypothetical protein
MSFGFSPSDIVALVNITTKAYRGWKNACGEYSEVTGSLDSLLIVLERIENEASKPNSVLLRTANDRQNLKDILSNSEPTLRELHAIVVRYKSLGPSREKNWDKLRFGVKNLDPLRVKLTQHIAAITAYLDAVGLGALGRIERDLNAIPERIQHTIDALAAEIRAGRREGSIMSTYSDDSKDVWKQFRRELIGDGMKSSFVHKYKPLIRKYLKELAERGELEEFAPENERAAEEILQEFDKPVDEALNTSRRRFSSAPKICMSKFEDPTDADTTGVNDAKSAQSFEKEEEQWRCPPPEGSSEPILPEAPPGAHVPPGNLHLEIWEDLLIDSTNDFMQQNRSLAAPLGDIWGDNEGAMIQSALERISRARAKGETTVELAQEEVDALERWKEEQSIKSAIDRISRARAKGETTVELTQEEVDALERRYEEQPIKSALYKSDRARSEGETSTQLTQEEADALVQRKELLGADISAHVFDRRATLAHALLIL